MALNAERTREEAAGAVRWLRPDYQIPRFAKGAAARTGELGLGTMAATAVTLPDFPVGRDEQPLAVEALLRAADRPMAAAEIARGFRRGGWRIEARIAQSLATLDLYGRIGAAGDGRYVARRAARAPGAAPLPTESPGDRPVRSRALPSAGKGRTRG